MKRLETGIKTFVIVALASFSVAISAQNHSGGAGAMRPDVKSCKDNPNAADAVDYVKQVGSPRCRVLLDSFHLNIEEDNIHDAIVSTGKYLGHVHIGETNRRAPGRGRMPWDEIFGALKRINYAGAITMDANRNAKKAIVIIKIEDGKFKYHSKIEPK